MSKKRTNYTSAFKTKLVLELLQNADTLAEIAMEPSKAVKEYKEELIKSQEQNERLTALVGKVQWSDKLGHKDSLIIQTIRRSINDTSKNQEATRNVYG